MAGRAPEFIGRPAGHQAQAKGRGLARPRDEDRLGQSNRGRAGLYRRQGHQTGTARGRSYPWSGKGLPSVAV
jgi:hypothetical protein